MRLKARPRAFAAVILALPALSGIFANRTVGELDWDGRFFQVTPQGGIVWEHVPPYLGRTQVDGKPFISILVSSGASAPESTKSARLQDQETTYGVYVGRCHTRTDEMLKVDGNAVFEPTPPPQPLGFPTARLAMMKNG